MYEKLYFKTKCKKTVLSSIYLFFCLRYDISTGVDDYGVFWKNTTEIFRHAEHLFPQTFHLGNYIKGWKGFANVSFTVFLKNSLIISGLATVGAVCSSAVIAYGFARCKFRGKGIWLVQCLYP
ncbi:MAG: hypothetical protein V8S98_05380 [Lachnospiraceae bacterium]